MLIIFERDYIYICISKIPHNTTSDSLIAFPNKFCQYNFSSALFCCISLQSYIFFERVEHKGSDTAQVTYTSSPIAFKEATLWGNQVLAQKSHFIIASYLLNQIFYALKNSVFPSCSAITKGSCSAGVLTHIFPAAVQIWLLKGKGKKKKSVSSHLSQPLFSCCGIFLHYAAASDCKPL